MSSEVNGRCVHSLRATAATNDAVLSMESSEGLMLLRYRALIEKFYEPGNYIVVQIVTRQIFDFDVSRIGSHDSLNVFIGRHAVPHKVLAEPGRGAAFLFLKFRKKPDPKVTGTSVRFPSVRIISPNSHCA